MNKKMEKQIIEIVEGPLYEKWEEDSMLVLYDFFIVRKKEGQPLRDQETYNQCFRRYQDALDAIEDGLDKEEWSQGHPLQEFFEDYWEDGRLYNSQHERIA